MHQDPLAPRHDRLAWKIALAVVAVDAVSKSWALWAFGESPWHFPGGSLQVSLVRGAGTWLGAGGVPVRAALDVLILATLAVLTRMIPSAHWAVAAGFAAGGAASDLIDRFARPPGLLHGALVHWIDTPWIPPFNLADVAYALAALLAASLHRPPGRA